MDHRAEGRDHQGDPHDIRCASSRHTPHAACSEKLTCTVLPRRRPGRLTSLARPAGASLDVLEEETAGTVPVGCVIIRGTAEAVQQAQVAVEGLLAYTDTRLAKQYSAKARARGRCVEPPA